MVEDDSALHEKPLEFFAGIATTDGDCDGQSILPENGRYRASCTCGNWSVEVDDAQDGLRMARAHTGSQAD